MTARRQNGDCRIGRKNEAPEEKRAFLPAPPCAELIEQRHVAVGMLRHIGHAEIAVDQRVDENAGRSRDQDPHRKHRALSAQREERFVFDSSDDARDNRVQRDAKRQQKSQRAYVFHIRSALTKSRTPLYWRPAAPVSGCCRALRRAWERTWMRTSPGSVRHETRRPDRGGHRRAPALHP